jgi:hypothetical protein
MAICFLDAELPLCTLFFCVISLFIVIYCSMFFFLLCMYCLVFDCIYFTLTLSAGVNPIAVNKYLSIYLTYVHRRRVQFKKKGLCNASISSRPKDVLTLPHHLLASQSKKKVPSGIKRLELTLPHINFQFDLHLHPSYKFTSNFHCFNFRICQRKQENYTGDITKKKTSNTPEIV